MRGREVVVTGMGVVSPIANELDAFWEGIQAGRSGIARVQSMEDIDQYPVQIAGEVGIKSKPRPGSEANGTNWCNKHLLDAIFVFVGWLFAGEDCFFSADEG